MVKFRPSIFGRTTNGPSPSITLMKPYNSPEGISNREKSQHPLKSLRLFTLK
jgi:hypothetical protein